MSMKLNSRGLRRKIVPRCTVLVALTAALLLPGSGAADSAPSTVSRLGMAMEPLRTNDQSLDSDGMEELHVRLAAGLEAASESLERGAFHLLLAELALARGQSDQAHRHLGEAGDQLEGAHYADDLDALRARILELAGDDLRADEAWEKWASRHSRSPRISETGLARVWNAIRRGDAVNAGARLEELLTDHLWLTDDPNVRLASATISWMLGNPDDALTRLGAGAEGPRESYLRAVCLDAVGKSLPAAAAYQEVANRTPASPLRDYALFRKADIFRRSKAYQSAAEEFQRVRDVASIEDLRAESAFRQALCHFLNGDPRPAEQLLTELPKGVSNDDVNARAQVLLAELLTREERYEEAIAVFSDVLGRYFEHDLAPRAQYRIGRCLDALGRSDEATSSYMAVVEGYSQSPEAPAAAYLAGVGLLHRGQSRAAVPHFQLLLDRYGERVSKGIATDEELELLASARYHLLASFRAAGDVSHIASTELNELDAANPIIWNVASRLLIADALSSQHRFADAQRMLEPILDWDGNPAVVIASGRLLSWVYAQQGHEDLAVETEQAILQRFASGDHRDELATAVLNRGHMFFNGKRYDEAVEAYEEFARDYPGHPRVTTSLYQAGMCYLRLDRAGDAVDRWEMVISEEPPSEVALNAATRAADVYFRAEDYSSASRLYDFLLSRFTEHPVAERAMLGKAQCAYNQGVDDAALQAYSTFLNRFPQSSLVPEAERGIEMALYRLGQQEDGLERLSQLVEQFPTSAFAGDAQYDIATKLYSDERFEEAATAFRRLVSQFPSHPSADRAQFFMAEALAASGNLVDARNGYEQFLVFFPPSDLRTTVQFRLGSLRFEAGDHMRAAVEFTSVLAGHPDEETRQASLYNLALCERALGRADDALGHLLTLTADPLVSIAAADVEYQIGELHADAGHATKAIEHYRIALASEPSDLLAIEVHFRLGAAHESLGDKVEAISEYEQAAGEELTEFRVPALTRCALLYEETDDMKNALRVYRELATTSSDPELVAAADQRADEIEAVVQ